MPLKDQFKAKAADLQNLDVTDVEDNIRKGRDKVDSIAEKIQGYAQLALKIVGRVESAVTLIRAVLNGEKAAEKLRGE
jgi:alanine dehydrogenase